jgi:hypothetical protein
LSRRLLAVLGLAGTVLGLALLARALPELRARRLPTQEAEWIWETRDPRVSTPAAFLAVQRFNLKQVPERARLLVAAEPEYVVYLNGKRLGVGTLPPTDRALRLDAYEVAPVLNAGANRIAVEVRSATGHGGLLARIADGEDRTLVATDRRWRLFEKSAQGVIRSWVEVASGRPAFSWGLPPIGRWGRPVVGESRGLLTEAAGSGVNARTRGAPSGQRFLYDFGREVTGLLQLELKVRDKLDAALLWTGTEPPRPYPGAPGSPVLVVAGHRRWLDVRPRRLRYALLVGLDGPASARLLPVDPAQWGGLFTEGTESRPGVLGIRAPPLRSPVEDEVWSEFKSVARVAGREEP